MYVRACMCLKVLSSNEGSDVTYVPVPLAMTPSHCEKRLLHCMPSTQNMHASQPRRPPKQFAAEPDGSELSPLPR